MSSNKFVWKSENGETFEVDMSKKIMMKGSDGGECFEVDAAVACEMLTIRNMVEDDVVDEVIPLRSITSKILAKVIEYCKKHVEAKREAVDRGGSSDEELKAWDAEFMKIDQSMLLELIMGANYMNVQNLVDLTCQTVAEMMKGKTPEVIRTTFDIKNDYSPEEEAEMRKEYRWAFE